MIRLLYRKPGEFISIEMVFNTLASSLESEYLLQKKYAPLDGVRLGSLIKNIKWAWGFRNDGINHVTGDIHYVCIGLKKQTSILTIHDIRVLNELHGIRRAVIKYLWFTLPLKRVGYVTVISEETKKQLLKEFPFCEEKVHVIPNSCNELFQFKPYSVNVIKPRILHVGTTNNKNLERVVEAIRGMSCKLYILGELSEEQSKFLAENKVDYESRFGLSEDEVVELYEMVDLVCFVSLYEGFGMPIIEAQSVGRPVLTSNISSMPDVAGEGALLVDPYNVIAIRQGIERILSDERFRQELIEKGQKNVKRFSRETVASQYTEIYKKIASESNIQVLKDKK